MTYRVLEICAGAGGQALGLEAAGFEHVAAVEIDRHACATLRQNRPDWNVIESDIRVFDGKPFRGRVDLLAGGVPCPPFSIAGKQLGSDDDRDLFPEAIRLVSEISPRAVMLENVPGFASEKFRSYRRLLIAQLAAIGYRADWHILNACDFGVPQLRPRFVLVAFRDPDFEFFEWPRGPERANTVAAAIGDLMASAGWRGAAEWAKRASAIAPTVVGGSKKHGGPDLGPTRARKQWLQLGVNGIGIANDPPGPEFPDDGAPKLTLRMVARVQGFPDSWSFAGGKTAAYRQVGNAFPPPVAEAVGCAVAAALGRVTRKESREQGVIFDRPILESSYRDEEKRRQQGLQSEGLGVLPRKRWAGRDIG